MKKNFVAVVALVVEGKGFQKFSFSCILIQKKNMFIKYTFFLNDFLEAQFS